MRDIFKYIDQVWIKKISLDLWTIRGGFRGRYLGWIMLLGGEKVDDVINRVFGEYNYGIKIKQNWALLSHIPMAKNRERIKIHFVYFRTLVRREKKRKKGKRREKEGRKRKMDFKVIST